MTRKEISKMTVAQTTNDSTSSLEDEQVAGTHEALPKDEIFHLLQNQRRRYVLQYLQEVDGTVEMRDMAEQVAAWEHDTTLQALTSDERQRVYIALYQAHLPKLNEKGVINYNQSRGIVEPTERIAQLTQYLDVSEEETDESTEDDDVAGSWGTYYLSASVFGGILLLVTAFDVAPFASISNIAAGAIILTVFVLLTLGQVAEETLLRD
jgi:hypothetical protein